MSIPVPGREALRYGVYGGALGLAFSLGALLLLYALGEFSLQAGLWAGLRHTHRDNPLLYIIHSAPFLLGLFWYFIGSQRARLHRLTQDLAGQVSQKTRELQEALEEMVVANDTILHMAEHDALTGLLNRRRFQADLEHWSEHARRYGRSMALLFLDLDDFKHVNDAYGHAAGDAYLRGTAQLLRQSLRGTDYLARWGGDEFAVLLPETSPEEAAEVADKLLAAFQAHPVMAGGRAWTVGVSIGVACLPRDTTDAEDLVAYADAAMYAAKQGGGSTWRRHDGARPALAAQP